MVVGIKKLVIILAIPLNGLGKVIIVDCGIPDALKCCWYKILYTVVPVYATDGTTFAPPIVKAKLKVVAEPTEVT